jgi:FlaG/FlaF family flagellin (archaellin)
MLDDGDTILRLAGVALLLGVVFAGGVVALNFDPPEQERVPDADWTIERVNDTHVRVTHAGGDPIRTENLHVTVDGLERATDFTNPVAPEDSTVVAASDSSLVRVAWEGSQTQREIMASERV